MSEGALNSINGNQRGGKRVGAGRPKGAATKKTREIADRAASDGLTPLEYMLDILRDVSADPAQRFEAAKHAAPYVHPKLSSVEAKVEADITANITQIELTGPEG